MNFNWTTLIWIAALLFVYIFGLIEGRGKGYKKRKEEEAQERREQPPPKPETVTIDDPGLLRIKNENGALTLDLDGTRVNPISLSVEQRKRLIEVLSVVRPWLEGRPAPTATSAISSAPPPSPKPAAVPAQPISAPRPADVQPSPTYPPSVDAAQGRSTSPRPGTIAKEDRPAAPANSIVTQIDSILQARLAGTPLDERGIFLTQSPEGGVMVYVGLTRYNGVDEVPDPEIKAAIRDAISEWEDKYTPGLQR